ncbi:MAG: acetyl-CoA carboxylase, carboxyltransferase subunit beta [Candidatus Aminicenantia bacterium]
MSDLWARCNFCKKIFYKKEIENNLNVCPACNAHFRIPAIKWIELLSDGPIEIEDENIKPTDPLNFFDTKPYKERLKESAEKSGVSEAVVNVFTRIDCIPVIISAMEYSFIGGSMGSVVGERIARGIEKAIEKKIPYITISCSGGARMQEGILSLMQMAKISALLALLDEAKVPFISILTDPTTGGVTASFAMLGDLNIAEPNALIGFAGPRVIEQTIRERLPKGFQRSEFLLEHGMLDMVVPRAKIKYTIALILRLLLNKYPEE